MNENNECLTFDGKYDDYSQKLVFDDQYVPHRIDLIIKERCCTHKVIDVYPVYHYLIIMVEKYSF